MRTEVLQEHPVSLFITEELCFQERRKIFDPIPKRHKQKRQHHNFQYSPV